MQLRKPATAILALALSAGLAQADDAAPAAGSTLDKIAKNGVIVVGHRESSVPFSYYDNQQKVVGYSQDYSNAIVEAVKKKLNKPDLQVKLIPITSQNRIPLLQNGTFDFECGSTTNNVERQKQAAFSDYFRGRYAPVDQKGWRYQRFCQPERQSRSRHFRHYL